VVNADSIGIFQIDLAWTILSSVAEKAHPDKGASMKMWAQAGRIRGKWNFHLAWHRDCNANARAVDF